MLLAEYSDEARREGIEGDVLLRVLIHRDGSVGATRVLEGLLPAVESNVQSKLTTTDSGSATSHIAPTQTRSQPKACSNLRGWIA